MNSVSITINVLPHTRETGSRVAFGFIDILMVTYDVQMYCETYCSKIFGRVFLSKYQAEAYNEVCITTFCCET